MDLIFEIADEVVSFADPEHTARTTRSREFQEILISASGSRMCLITSAVFPLTIRLCRPRVTITITTVMHDGTCQGSIRSKSALPLSDMSFVMHSFCFFTACKQEKKVSFRQKHQMFFFSLFQIIQSTA